MAKEKLPYRQKVRRYQLEKYTGIKSRHTCPSCGHNNVFARYVDVTTGDYASEDVGRCNREERCGYEKSPMDDTGKEFYVPINTIKKEYMASETSSIIDSKYIVNSLNGSSNNFTDFLLAKFDKDVVTSILNRYRVGSASLWEGATVFWQIDRDFDCRTGKIMLYSKETCKRVKEPYNHISWAHSPDKNNAFGSNEDFNLTQCFFGEHLLNNEDVTTFNVVESEKTAILCSIANPSTYWIATGGLQNINEERLLPFKDKKLVFYPDKGKAFEVWKNKLKPFMDGFDIVISSAVEKKVELMEGEDLGDYVIKTVK